MPCEDDENPHKLPQVCSALARMRGVRVGQDIAWFKSTYWGERIK